MQTTSSLRERLSGKRWAFRFDVSDVIWQSICLLPILGVSLAGIRRNSVLILPNIGPWDKLRTLFQAHSKVALYEMNHISHIELRI